MGAMGAMQPQFIDICALDDIAPLGSRVVARPGAAPIAVFRAADDTVFAVLDRCPHKGGPLSQGIVHGHRVTCPLHNWTIELASGEAAAPDRGCVRRFEIRVEGGRVLLSAAAWIDTDTFDIRLDTTLDDAVVALLNEHQGAMDAISPPESRHALDRSGLLDPSVTFWTLWRGDVLAGCGALKELERTHAEVKSMRTTASCQRQGVGRAMLRHLIAEAERRGYTRLSLETGSMPYFEPARRLYASAGFVECEPFGSYRLDPNSVYMTKALA
jgi:putative acetyltransferase